MSTTSTYTVTGMTCGHCVASVTEEINRVDGVTAVAVDLASGRVTVESDGPLDASAVAAVVDEALENMVAEATKAIERLVKA